MSQSLSISKVVHARFREVFGQPHRSMGKDDHWSLQPTPMKAPIYVLVNGTTEHPAIWMFDTHSKNDGVFSKTVTNEDELHEVIKQIQDRVKSVARPSGSPNGELRT